MKVAFPMRVFWKLKGGCVLQYSWGYSFDEQFVGMVMRRARMTEVVVDKVDGVEVVSEDV